MAIKANYRLAASTVMPMQGRTKEQPVPDIAVQFMCSLCGIRYTVPKGDHPICPLCDANKQIQQLRAALRQSSETAANTQEQVQRLKVELDDVEAIREAISVTGIEDLTFLKSALYRYRADPTISLQALQPSGNRSKKAQANRFVLEKRSGGYDTDDQIYEGYVCTSIGGLAIANYFRNITRQQGAKTAMLRLTRAFSQELIGGVG